MSESTPICPTCTYYQHNYCSEYGTVIPSDILPLPDCCESYEPKSPDAKDTK